jgi:AcrR family transcriptional regulator
MNERSFRKSHMSDQHYLSLADGSRGQIIRAAHDLFVRQGYHGTSMRQIASAAGVALGGIYNYFSGKEDIFRTVFWEYHPYRDVLPAIAQIPNASFEEMLHSVARQMLQALERRPDFLNLVLIEVVEFNSQHIGELIDTLLPEVYATMSRFILSDSRLRQIPFPILVRAFIGLFISYYITDKLMTGAVVPEEFRAGAMGYFVEIFLHGILNSPAPGFIRPLPEE